MRTRTRGHLTREQVRRLFYPWGATALLFSDATSTEICAVSLHDTLPILSENVAVSHANSHPRPPGKRTGETPILPLGRNRTATELRQLACVRRSIVRSQRSLTFRDRRCFSCELAPAAT